MVNAYGKSLIDSRQRATLPHAKRIDEARDLRARNAFRAAHRTLSYESPAGGCELRPRINQLETLALLHDGAPTLVADRAA
jgi:hypothetical protein